MSRKLLCVCAVVGILAGVARGDEKADLKKENAELKKKVERLEGEIAKMKAQAKARGKEAEPWLEVKPLLPGTLELPQPMVPLTPQLKMITPPSGQTLPPGTVEKRFDGETFYVIPVSGNLSAGGAARDRGVAPVLVVPQKK